MQAVELEIVGKILNIILQISGIIIGLLLVTGYIFYIGKRVGNRLKLRETPAYELKMERIFTGLILLGLFLFFLILSGFIYRSQQFPEMKIFSLNAVVFIVGLSVWLLFSSYVIKREKDKRETLKNILYILSFSLLFRPFAFLNDNWKGRRLAAARLAAFSASSPCLLPCSAPTTTPQKTRPIPFQP